MRPTKLQFALLTFLLLCSVGTPSAAPVTKKVDLFVVSEKVFVPGSTAAIRVLCKAVRSLMESHPLPGAEIRISLHGKGKQQQLYAGRSDGNGGVEATFQVPAWPLGSYQLAVQARSREMQTKVEQGVELRQHGRILLITDKPIYQPRQVMNMRALVLSAHDLRPLGNEALRFEVQDPKGNKVFRQELRANTYGVVATTFQLADEINLGNYQIEVSAVGKDLAEPAAKTVVVKKYVLPKFKVAVETDRSFYLPQQTVKGTVRSDYFFGKPVSGGKITVEASTFDGTAFRKFGSLKGQTGKDGSWKFEVALPDYFVGQPLLKGDALVKLEVKVVDTANHAEMGVRSLPVSATPIRVTAIADGARLVPGVENQIYVVTTYPDGSPVSASVTAKAGSKLVGTIQTDSAGVGSFAFTPQQSQLRPGEYKQRSAPGQSGWVQTRALDLTLAVRDSQGNTATLNKTLSSDPDQNQVLLRTDKAIYKAGDVLEATVLATGSGPDAMYLDVVKNHQTVLTRVVYLKHGKASLRMSLGSDLFGSLELHAYRIQPDGEMTRDARVLYVQPSTELTVEVAPDRKVYRPGGKATIQFRVTDSQGQPQAAAIGVVIVDEAVYALQEIQPGLEKVYFTLERELSKPKYEIEFAPADNLTEIVKARQLEARRQRVAKVLLAGARPTTEPGLWENPVTDRLQQAQQSRYAIQSAIYRGLWQPKLKLFARGKNGRWVYQPDLLKKLRAKSYISDENLKDPLGEPYTMHIIEKLWPELSAAALIGGQELSRLWSLRYQVQYELNRRTSNFTKLGQRSLAAYVEAAFHAIMKKNRGGYLDPAGEPYRWGYIAKLPGFRAEDFVAEVHQQRVQQIYYALSALAYRDAQAGGAKRITLDAKRNAWVFPTGSIRAVVKRGLLQAQYAKDVWGHPFVLRARTQPRAGYYYDQRLRFYDVVSAGPDGRLASDDDLVYPRSADEQNLHQRLAKALGVTQTYASRWRGWGRGGGGFGGLRRRVAKDVDAMDDLRAVGAEMARPAAAPVATERMRGDADRKAEMKSNVQAQNQPGAPVKREVRVREYFPETLLFKPALITDGQGKAKLELAMADSITTWRLTASANSASGSLGSTSAGLKVFQDFFVDLDLPVSLTQNDEVSVPVVVYNYLKQTQRVRLELKNEPWFELKGNRVLELQLAPAEVAASYYRIKVKDLGRRTLEVRADGSQMSDAIRCEIEVLPDGQEQNWVANGRLEGVVSKTISIPGSAVPGASKLLVRLYPGVFSQVIEGMQSMLRLPGGCMEQTSSISYPNILVLRYLRKTGQVAPEVAMKAHEFINLGYQRLLTFESPTGGFNWWGNSEPGNVVLTGLGIQQFEEMSHVHSVDRGIIKRSRAWLAKKQSADGAWDKDTHLHSFNAQLGSTKLRTTSYVLWSLLQGGDQGQHVDKGIKYVKAHLGDARGDLYSLALAANALALWNAKDPVLAKLLAELASRKVTDSQHKTVYWPTSGDTETYSRGSTAAIETTALVAVAMIKADTHHALVNGALGFLVQSKGAYGNWDSTQATVLALKALLASMAGASQKTDMHVSVLLNGKELGRERFTPSNSDIMRLVDFGSVGPGDHLVELKSQGKANVMFQIVGRYFEPWKEKAPKQQEPLSIALQYDRKRLRVDDILTASVRVAYHLDRPTFNVIVDLGIPPGFSVMSEDLEKLVKSQSITKYSTTGRQITLYIGAMEKNKPLSFSYRLKAKFPVRAKTPRSVAYEYYTPTAKGVQQPELIVVEQR